MTEKKTITVEMTTQEAWALVRINAQLSRLLSEKDDRIDQEDVLPFSWVSQRVVKMVADPDIIAYVTDKMADKILQGD